ncbi:serine/threonine protein kinase [Catenulispora sp. NL8]|uniref:non-specific serine/threonine protein kinase n=1 Tax=Catenulispora pinistramenti TaxID=2705254 RepID=A0ABS5KVQ9_9ACTN|nr:serine/threonine-protein kinase [Catenulispora pinistramenti]MBS2550084.1 serine/threonine protein kinase [Catenulispora pinistramenti]
MSDDVDTEQLAPPERVIAERYILRTELGRGGMGVVWRAEDRIIARPVAVKEMRLADGVTTSERAEFEQRILREARTAGRLNDPAVVTVYDVVHDNGSVFIVMELVEAPTLAQLVRRSGPLSPRAVADIGRQVLSALEAAHGAGIVHRDVKPSNIMVGHNGRAKLTDFGIAQAVDDPTLTKTGAVIGSPAYLAPERLSGQEASAASDLWSLGAVLYFAIEGKPAFERDTTAATFGAVLNEVPYLTNVQGPLAAAISGMLATSPEGRLTAPQVRTLLDAVAADSTKSVPQGTMVMPASGAPTATMSIGGPPPADGTAAGIAVSPPAKRSWARIAGTFAAAVLVTGAVAGFAGYDTGSSSGKKQAQKADAGPWNAVTVYSLGGVGADFPNLALNSQATCMSGPPFAPGTPTYQNSNDCSGPHDVELYYQTDMINPPYDNNDATSDSPDVPYPGVAQLTAMARQMCWADRQMTAAWTDPKGSQYSYFALIPSENLWTDKNLPSGWGPDDKVSCLMTNAPGKQLPGDTSH